MADDLDQYKVRAEIWCLELGIDPGVAGHRCKYVPLELATPNGPVWMYPNAEVPRPVWTYYAEALRRLDKLGFLKNG